MNRQKQIEQLADQLVNNGTCGLPLTFNDVARKVASHPEYPLFLKCTMRASPAVSEYFILERARELVDDVLPMEELDHA